MVLSCITSKRRLREQQKQQARSSESTVEASIQEEEWKPRRATVKAVFAFNAEAPGDLTLAPDQEIQVTMQNKDWFLGWYSLDGEIFEGVFPQNHVVVVSYVTL